MDVAASSEQLQRLAEELGRLTSEERARVIAAVSRRPERDEGRKFVVPKLGGGEAWIGGGLHRDELYGDEGR